MKKFILLLVFLVSGCQSGPEQIPFTTLIQATSKEDAIFRAHAPENSLIQDSSSWDEIWHDLTRFIPFQYQRLSGGALGRLRPTAEPIPHIDFDEYWVLVTVGESRVQMECFIEVRAVETTGRRLVTTSISSPPTIENASGANDTYRPFHIIRIPRLDDNLQPDWLNFTIRRIN